MTESRIIVLEPSKVGTQHITLINPYLEAAESIIGRSVEFWCAPSMWANVSEPLKKSVRHKAIPVIDPSSRQFLIKIPLEILVTLWAILRKKSGDTLLITCLFSPALYLVAWICYIFRVNSVHIVLHSEVESIVDPTLSPKISGYGYWMRKFWRHCLGHNTPNLVVIDNFIQNRMLKLSKSKLKPERLRVLTMPLSLPSDEAKKTDGTQHRDKPLVCFIGYRTRLKGFNKFTDIAKERTDFSWRAVGGGIIEDIATGEITPLNRAEDFGLAVSNCDIALFPYEAGYDVSMSAAVLDAISNGLHVIASPRGCFVALSEVFGEDILQCAEGIEEINNALDKWLNMAHRPTRSDYADRIAASRFSQSNLNKEMRDLLDANAAHHKERP